MVLGALVMTLFQLARSPSSSTHTLLPPVATHLQTMLIMSLGVRRLEQLAVTAKWLWQGRAGVAALVGGDMVFVYL